MVVVSGNTTVPQYMINSMFENMKKLIAKINTSNEFLEDAQMKWEFLKHEIRKFTIDYSKTAAKIRKQHNLI